MGAKLFNLDTFSLAYITHTHCQHNGSSRLAAHHSHLDTLPSLPTHSSRHAQWANTELPSALFVAILCQGSLDGMVWCFGMFLLHVTPASVEHLKNVLHCNILQYILNRIFKLITINHSTNAITANLCSQETHKT